MELLPRPGQLIAQLVHLVVPLFAASPRKGSPRRLLYMEPYVRRHRLCSKQAARRSFASRDSHVQLPALHALSAYCRRSGWLLDGTPFLRSPSNFGTPPRRIARQNFSSSIFIPKLGTSLPNLRNTAKSSETGADTVSRIRFDLPRTEFGGICMFFSERRRDAHRHSRLFEILRRDYGSRPPFRMAARRCASYHVYM